MANYTIIDKAPKSHTPPPLLRDVAKWIGKQKHGSLGWFDTFGGEPIPKEWDEENADRLRRSGFAFLQLPDGSLLALLEAGDEAPPPVVLLGSEGERRTVATSFEAFLKLWSKGETDIAELDDEDGGKGRRALGEWLTSHGVKVPKAPEFDFQAWLDGPLGAAAPPPPAALVREPTAAMSKLGPKMQKLASLLGMRADAPEVQAYVTKTLGKKVPQSTSESNADASVEAPKAGVELSLTHEVLNERYPPIHKTAKSFVPYVSYAWVYPKIGERVLGVPWDVSSRGEVEKHLGAPTTMCGSDKSTPRWDVLLDEGAQTMLSIFFERSKVSATLSLREALEIERYDRVEAGVFLGWAATHGLLDDARFAAHGALLAAVKKRKAKGSELFDALARGLWDDHLKDDAELRKVAYDYFHNSGKAWITKDLIKVFGKRKGPYGHDEPKLDDATWDAVDRASEILSERFARWMR
jgi:hypothetical protein